MSRSVSQPYLQIDVGLKHDADYIAFARAVRVALPDGARPYAARIARDLLIDIWSTFLERHAHGRPLELAETRARAGDVVESWVDWDGTPGALAEAFFTHICVESDGELAIRGWDDRYGEIAMKRDKACKKKRSQRARGDKHAKCPPVEGTDSLNSMLEPDSQASNRPIPLETPRAHVPDSGGQSPHMSPTERGQHIELSPEKGTETDKKFKKFEELTPLPPPGGGGASPFPPPPNRGGTPASPEPPPPDDAVEELLDDDPAPAGTADAAAFDVTSIPGRPIGTRGVSTAVPEAQAVPVPTRPPSAVAVAQGITDPVMLARQARYADALDAAVAEVPHPGARGAIRRLLEELHILPDRWPRHVSRMVGWQTGLGASGLRPVSWEAIDEGIHELLDGDNGQPITPQVVLAFVERAERRRQGVDMGGAASRPAATAPTATAPSVGGLSRLEIHDARRCAEQGDPEGIEFCHKHGITFTPRVLAESGS